MLTKIQGVKETLSMLWNQKYYDVLFLRFLYLKDPLLPFYTRNIIQIWNQQEILRTLTILVSKISTSGPILEPEVDEIFEFGQLVTYQIDAQKISYHLREESMPTAVKSTAKKLKKNHKFMHFFPVLPVGLTAVGMVFLNDL